ncbi:SDR family NAD(P)-dependent oxidoreductase [Actinokineospora pegani]|uniref:SDR family NAD(P)-dependent oxidoreductase n=1 Tax=Actinokineospora pegani TaxID=2654637 RepID=UPI0022A6E3BB|nr:SDR family NAD(P)-dependent oxidoreductase [Actinokineospora pegani]
MAAEGAHVFAVARSPITADLVTPEGVAALAALGEVDVLVNNLGGVIPESMGAAGFLAIDDDAWQRTYELNLFATVRVTRALLPGLLARRGVVVTVSSIGARAAFPPVDHGTAKAALNNLTKALSEEFAPSGLRALTVTPGPTRTAN